MNEQWTTERPKITWSDLRTFTQEGSELAVRVQVSDGNRPMYSMQVGRVREGRFLPFLRPDISTQGGQVYLRPTDANVIAQLLMDAEALVVEKTQEHENLYQARRQARDAQNFGGPGRGDRNESRFGSKPPRDRDRRHRREDHDDNWS